MLFIKQPDKLERVQPLLPIISDDVNAARDSPLAALAKQAFLNSPQLNTFEVGGDEDEMYASLLEPLGPWHLEKDLKVPDCAANVKFTTKHEKTNIAIGHRLKVTIRVERGDDVALDAKGRRKQFDIIIETPIKILDCRVNPQWNSLPTYSQLNPTGASTVPAVCSIHSSRHNGPALGHIPALPDPAVIAASPAIRTVGLPPFEDRGRSQSRERRAIDVPISSTTPRDRTPGHENEDTLLERNIVYDRLMSGQETETGEHPPTYREAIASAQRSGSTSRSRSRAGRRSSLIGAEARGDSGSRSRSRLRESTVG